MSTSRLTEQQRQFLRDRQRLDLQALAAYTRAASHLEAALAHRAEILAREDAQIRDAKSALTTATRALVERVGVEQAAVLTGTQIEAKRGPGRPPAA